MKPNPNPALITWREVVEINGKMRIVIVEAEFYKRYYEDYNRFVIKASIKRLNNNIESLEAIPKEIIKLFPELENAEKFNFMSTKGPVNYRYNTIFYVENNELDLARKSAIWPDATDKELELDGLKERLDKRLNNLLIEFYTMLIKLGFSHTHYPELPKILKKLKDKDKVKLC